MKMTFTLVLLLLTEGCASAQVADGILAQDIQNDPVMLDIPTGEQSICDLDGHIISESSYVINGRGPICTVVFSYPAQVDPDILDRLFLGTEIRLGYSHSSGRLGKCF